MSLRIADPASRPNNSLVGRLTWCLTYRHLPPDERGDTGTDGPPSPVAIFEEMAIVIVVILGLSMVVGLAL